jgi:hypothetical protein
MTPEQARDAINSLFWEGWKDATPPLNAGVAPEVAWQDQELTEQQTLDKVWVRFTVRHLDGGDTALGGSLRETVGIATAQIFVPKNKGLALGDKLAKIVLDIFQGERTSGVWFRNVRMRDVGPDKGWVQTNVIAEFRYDDLKA